MKRITLIILCYLMCVNANAQDQKHSDGLDDVLQYVPYTSVFALKALGVDSKDNWEDLMLTTAASWVITAGVTYGLKHSVKEWRPDNTDQKSFPSGHSAFAFAGATMLRHEYGHLSPWITAAGYGVATFTAVDRVLKDRHHWYDVVAGAAIGAGVGELTWYLSRKMFNTDNVAIGFNGTQMDVVINVGGKKSRGGYSSYIHKRSTVEDTTQLRTKPLWHNWFVQIGVDMSLQNPYGYNFAHVFPNGKTFGIDVGVGKWFTPLFGVRGKLNWENGIKALENGHANWLAPFHQPGDNLRKGGYVALYGDVLLNLHNLFGRYKEDRKWNAILHPRAGADYNFGAEDGSPVLGLGIENTYKLTNRWSLYADVAYNFTSGAVAEPGTTGVGSGSNGYFVIEAGAQISLGKQGFAKAENGNKSEVLIPGIWSNWFIQAGLDMSLQNPYGCNFSHVFPNGNTYGVNVAVGKWFTPEVAVRGHLNWENGLIENKQLTWLPPSDDPRSNYKGGGYVVATGEVLLNLNNLLGSYNEDRKWNISIYPKAGLIKQLKIDSGSPLVGLGVENTYRLNDRLSLYADVDYQVTTSESSVNDTGASGGSNGFFKLEAGIQIDLGRSSGKYQRK